MSETATERLIGPRGIADWLDVPLGTVYRWRQTGDGPPGFRVGRHLRYRREDVEAWLNRQQQAEHRTAV